MFATKTISKDAGLQHNTTELFFFKEKSSDQAAVSSSDGGEMICVDKNLCSAHLFVIL